MKLYFGKTNRDEQQELKQEITDLLQETEHCSNRIQMLIQEVNKNVNTMHQNTAEIVAKKRKIDETPQEFKLKNLAILLSRTDELKRIQNYYDSLQ